MQARFPSRGFPFKNVRTLEYSPGIALALAGGDAQRSGLEPDQLKRECIREVVHRKALASGPQTSELLLIAEMGMLMISHLLTRILDRLVPYLSVYPTCEPFSDTDVTGISSPPSFIHTLIVFVTGKPIHRIAIERLRLDTPGACTRSVSRTTQSRYSHLRISSVSSACVHDVGISRSADRRMD